MPDTQWTDVGSVEELKKKPLQEVSLREDDNRADVQRRLVCRDFRSLQSCRWPVG